MRPRACRSLTRPYFCAPEPLELPGAALPAPDPTVPDELPDVMASKTDMPCGPIVMTTGFPSFDLACTTKDSATTFTSVKPADCRSFLMLSIADLFWAPPLDWAASAGLF